MTIGIAQNDPTDSWDGPYSPIPVHHNQGNFAHCCEIAHAILMGASGPMQGKVMLIQSNGDVWFWDPAAPNSVTTSTPCPIETPIDNLFCAGHSVDAQGRVVTHGGNRSLIAPCLPQPRYSYVFDTATGCWSGALPLVVPNPNPAPTPENLGYWYPSSLKLPDGRIVSLGGGSSPLSNTTPTIPGSNVCNDAGNVFFNDGWQLFDPALNVWSAKTNPTDWFAGLPGNSLGGTNLLYDNNFNYYPLTVMLPGGTGGAGTVFIAASTNNRVTKNDPSFTISAASSVSAIMDLGASGWPSAANVWSLRDQVDTPLGAPRNLYYPNGVLRPLLLGSNGLLLPTAQVEFMVLGGADNNVLPVNGPGPAGINERGRPALVEVQQIAAPELAGSTWSANGTRFPNMIHPRIYGNAVLLPTGHLFAVGGSRYDFVPFGPPPPPPPSTNLRYERQADPVYEPELLDLFDSQPAWQSGSPHVSPRLYHSAALVLPDARVLVAGGYRGSMSTGAPPNAQWNWDTFDPFAIPPVANPHSDLEIYTPASLLTGRRPEIVLTSLSGPNADTMNYGALVQVTVAVPGASDPVAEMLSVCLLSCGSVTHHYDWDQRYVGLWFDRVVGTTNQIVVKAPANGTLAPPGWYMMFLVARDAGGTFRVPSIAKFVRVT